MPLLKQAADWAAELEMAGVRTVSNAADPMRDGFVKQLTMIWKSYGGRISHAEDGPLIRFLSAVTAPVLILAGEEPMTADALRGIVRRIRERAARPHGELSAKINFNSPLFRGHTLSYPSQHRNC